MGPAMWLSTMASTSEGLCSRGAAQRTSEDSALGFLLQAGKGSGKGVWGEQILASG